MRENVTLRIIGSGDAFSTGGRFHTCFYVHSRHYRFLIDCGATAFVALKQQNIQLSSIDAIVLTHLHGDHFGGIPFILIAGMFEKSRPRPLKIIGPKGTESAIKKSFEIFYPTSTGMHCEFQEYEAGQHNIDELEILATKAEHIAATNPHSLRIKFKNKIIAYSGDTEWYNDLKIIFHEADIFICECSHTAPVKGHISYEELVAQKNIINAKKILLTHMSDSMLNKEDCIFEKAHDGMRIEL